MHTRSLELKLAIYCMNLQQNINNYGWTYSKPNIRVSFWKIGWKLVRPKQYIAATSDFQIRDVSAVSQGFIQNDSSKIVVRRVFPARYLQP